MGRERAELIQLQCVFQKQMNAAVPLLGGRHRAASIPPTLHSYLPRPTVPLQRWPLHMNVWPALVDLQRADRSVGTRGGSSAHLPTRACDASFTQMVAGVSMDGVKRRPKAVTVQTHFD